MFDRIVQKAGKDSQQIQAQAVHIGIDEKRVREIIDEKMQGAIDIFTNEAYDVALNRVSIFRDQLVPRMVEKQMLDAFADPAFQLQLIEAQKAAAASERPLDYNLLSELLIHRVEKRNDRETLAGISRAVTIVDEITDDALLALTIAYVFGQFYPTTGNIIEGLDVLDNLYGKIANNVLPTGSQWIEHLDVLSAVRISSFSGLKNVSSFFPTKVCAYALPGIKKDSESHESALKILANANISSESLVVHELNSDYLRFNFTSNINEAAIDGASINNNPIQPIQTQALKDVFALYTNDQSIKNDFVTLFMNEWNNRLNLKMVGNWWDAIPFGFSITAVGRVLAHANAQRIDPTIPPIS